MRGHILLSPETKGCKNAAGVPPDPKGSCRFSFQENLPTVIIKTDDTIRGCGPGDWGLCAFSVPRPTGPRGPRAPSLYGRGQVAAFELIFIERKSTKPPGGSGGFAPWRFFPPFLDVKKGGAARHERI